ncbi:MAG: hypothetical protein LC777_17230 [Actinobacteria bacterium]|nr:hypothetical protein [Actinomycetota bacterium]
MIEADIRYGEATAQVMALNEDAGNRIARSAREAQRLAVQARAAARAPAPKRSYEPPPA